MTEKPITVGPKQFTPPICLGCYRYLLYNIWRRRYCTLLRLLLQLQVLYIDQKKNITNVYIFLEMSMDPIDVEAVIGLYVAAKGVKRNPFIKRLENAIF